MEYPQELEEDTEIEVRIFKESGQGKIFSIDQESKSVQILVEVYLGSSIPEAKLVISNNYLLKILCDRLEEVKNSSHHLTEFAEGILYPSKFDNALKDIDFPDFQINEHQKDAAQLALGSKISYIWGPPGTGKTHTIAPIISSLIKEDKSVLLISHTNLATDQALSQFLKKSKVNLD